jgi:hypothetical protein
MKRLVQGALTVLLIAALAPSASAHPTPFSYFDIRINDGYAQLDLVAHIIDVAHDLSIEPPEQLLQADVLRQRGSDIAKLLGARLSLQVDGRAVLAGTWSPVDPLPERQSLHLSTRFPLASPPGTLRLNALMFPYDPQHQSFINVYEGDALRLQAILDHSKTDVEFYSGTTRGILAVLRTFFVTGFRHILLGPEHLLFLAGLLLLGGTVWQLGLVVSGFTLANALTLSLASFNVLTAPSRIVEPAIALSIVYVGADNLMVRGGRDMRAWIAFAFGFIHGLGYAAVLRSMDLSRPALKWSLLSFNAGVEVAQLIVVVIVVGLLAALRSRSEAAGQRVVYVGSILVIAAGAFWFVQRVFFPGGLA